MARTYVTLFMNANPKAAAHPSSFDGKPVVWIESADGSVTMFFEDDNQVLQVVNTLVEYLESVGKEKP